MLPGRYCVPLTLQMHWLVVTACDVGVIITCGDAEGVVVVVNVPVMTTGSVVSVLVVEGCDVELEVTII